MDRELPSSFKKKRIIKMAVLGGLIITSAIISFFTIRAYLQPTVERTAVDFSIAGKGNIEATVTASGLVVPENEFLITSPIHAKIEQVLRHSGEAVNVGESILQLDKQTTLNDYDKLLDEQAVNHNREEQLELTQESTLTELNTQYAIKQMSIQSVETALDHERALLKIGGSTDEKIKQATLNLEIARLELGQLKSKVKNQEKVMQSDKKGLGYQISIQQKNITAYSRKLNAAALRSPAKGIVTWVNSKVGAEVNEGAELARVADLSSYKIEGKIADAYAAQLKTGRQVIVKIEDEELRGTVTTIQPEVEGGMVKFSVSLNQSNHTMLRANLKVDLYLVTSIKHNVLRVKNGSVFTGAEQQQVFVVRGKEAVSRMVSIGLSNFEYTEILSGLMPGDEVVITELKEHQNVQKLVIKD